MNDTPWFDDKYLGLIPALPGTRAVYLTTGPTGVVTIPVVAWLALAEKDSQGAIRVRAMIAEDADPSPADEPEGFWYVLTPGDRPPSAEGIAAEQKRRADHAAKRAAA